MDSHVARDKLPVTVVVPVKNDAAPLAACLASLAEFAHVWVVDSGSSDATPQVAAAAGARIIPFTWNGRYPKKRNWVLLTQAIPTPWVLFLDADERATPAFCAELRTLLNETDCNGFWCRYSNSFLGRPLRFGLPQRKLALLRVGAGLYERVDDEAWTSLDMEVHEHPQVQGKVGTLRAHLIHAQQPDLVPFLTRHLDYARWEARRFLTREGRETSAALTLRQKVKYRCLAGAWFAPAYFIYVYILRLGVLDGSAGLLYAFYKLWYFVTIRQLILSGRRAKSA
jgi:glycosyltransferase involved in cell wall biosynthesis